MVKTVQRLLFASVALFAINNAKAGDLFGAVQASRPASLERLNMADYRLPWLALADAPLGSISTAYTNIAMSTPRHVAAAPVPIAGDPAPLKNDWKSSVWTSGEVGFLYGHSAGGKHSFDTEQGYIFGTVGNDNIQITAGAAYERWDGHGWRGR